MCAKLIHGGNLGTHHHSPKYDNTIRRHRLFELDHTTMKVFGFQPGIASPRAMMMMKQAQLIHGTLMVAKLDSALTMLGPDIEMVEDILGELGDRHERYGVQADMFPVFGCAIRQVLQETLGDKYDKKTDEAWSIVYEELSGEIIKSMSSSPSS